GKPKHKGKTLELSTAPDIVVSLLPSHCVCGHALDKSQATVLERRQVFDLPQPKLLITEYQKLACKCGGCGLSIHGIFPDAIPSRVQYGSGVRSLTSLLNCAFAMPIKKIQQLFIDLFGYAINESTISNNNSRCADLLEPIEQQIKEKLLASEVGHVDESGVRVAGRLHWLHTFSSTLFTFFFVHARRGRKALEDSMSLLPGFSAWLVHDCWSSYFRFTGCRHALCGAHIIRELTALEEKNIIWAKWFKRYLLTLFERAQTNDGVLPKSMQQKALLLFDRIAQYADAIEPQPKKIEGKKGKPKATKGRNLLNRLVKHREAVLAFAFHQEVPFTNNLAERDLRPIKTKQKVSGCFRTKVGADKHARIYGYISSARKNNLNIFKELKSIFDGNTSAIFEGAK
ncbi:MAG: IS66 family transposase, partial [Bacteroidota bacterium]